MPVVAGSSYSSAIEAATYGRGLDIIHDQKPVAVAVGGGPRLRDHSGHQDSHCYPTKRVPQYAISPTWLRRMEERTAPLVIFSGRFSINETEGFLIKASVLETNE